MYVVKSGWDGWFVVFERKGAEKSPIMVNDKSIREEGIETRMTQRERERDQIGQAMSRACTDEDS